jgi:tetratricopeptide (TPR) repeat protein
MTRHLLTATVLAVLLVATVGSSHPRGPSSQGQGRSAVNPSVLVLSHANIVDVVSGTVRRDHTVTIRDGRIIAIGPGSRSPAPTGAQVSDATGKYLIPGLVDMHVHWYDERYLGLFLANGVTGVRLMLGNEIHLQWRSRMENGELPGPRLAIASPIVDGPNPRSPGSLVVTDPESARAAVSRLQADGYDFIKVYNGVPRDAFFALAREATSRGLPVAGHVPRTVSLAEVSDSGQRSIEHLGGLLYAVSREGGKARQTAAQPGPGERAPSAGTLAAAWKVNEPLLASYDASKAAALFAQFVKNGTWQCPTLTLLRAHAFLHDREFTGDVRLKYMPRHVRQLWSDDPRGRGLRTEDFATGRRVLAKDFELVRDMHKAGVRLLAGTDTMNPFVFPGFSLHDELSLLVGAGLSPLEALRTATINPAVYLGTERSAGTIDVGKQADLVLLDGNPLDDIANTKRIQAVVVAGRLLSRTDLDATLTKIEKLANLPSIASTLAATIKKDGVDATVTQYRELKAQQPDAYDYGEMELNGLGYMLLRAGRMDDAVQIFTLNVEAYPNSWIAYDSLAEAYMERGDRELAIANYRKSLKLNPKNAKAIERLKKLGGG